MLNKQSPISISILLIVGLMLAACQPLPSASTTTDAYPPPDAAATEEAKPAPEVSPYPGPGDPTVTPMPTLRPPLPACEYQASLESSSLSPVTLDSFVFGKPSVALSGKTGLLVINWLSETNDLLFARELRERVGESIESLNLDTGEILKYGEKSGDSTSFNPKPIWSIKDQNVLFAEISPALEISLVRGISGEAGAEQLTNSLGSPYLAISPIDNSIIVASKSDGGKLISFDTQEKKEGYSIFDFSGFAESPDKLVIPINSISWQPRGNLVTISGRFGLLLGNTVNGSLCRVNLNQKSIGDYWALNAVWSPSGNYVAFLETIGDPIVPYIHVALLNIATGDIRSIDLGLQSIYSLVWSPISDYFIAVGSRDMQTLATENKLNQQEMYLVDAETGKYKRVLDGEPLHFTGIWGIAWKPDGKSVAYSCPQVDASSLVIEGRICVVSVEIK